MAIINQMNGKTLKRKLNSRSGYAILDKYSGGTWCAGGCFFLALTLSKILKGELWVIFGKHNNCYDMTQHMVFKTGNLYYDGDGASTMEELLYRWKYKERIILPQLLPFNKTLPDYDYVKEILDSIKSKGGIPKLKEFLLKRA